MNGFFEMKVDPDCLPATLLLDNKLSDEDFQSLCFANDTVKIERTCAGEIRLLPLNGLTGGSASAAICGELVEWKRKHGHGKAFGFGVGYFLPGGSMLCPTASYLSEERYGIVQAQRRDDIPHICPNFVVELSTNREDLPVLQSKMLLWLHNGVELAWLIDPFAHRVWVYRPGEVPVIHNGRQIIYSSGAMAGFEFDTELVWEMYRF